MSHISQPIQPPRCAWCINLESALEYERADDLPSAARVAQDAVAAGGSEFAAVTAERLAPFGSGGAALAERLLAEAKAATDPVAQCGPHQRLSELDRVRGDSSSALLWQSAILEADPKHLRALRTLEHAYIREGASKTSNPSPRPWQGSSIAPSNGPRRARCAPITQRSHHGEDPRAGELHAHPRASVAVGAEDAQHGRAGLRRR